MLLGGCGDVGVSVSVECWALSVERLVLSVESLGWYKKESLSNAEASSLWVTSGIRTHDIQNHKFS